MQKEAELYSLRAQNIIGGNIYFFCDEIFKIFFKCLCPLYLDRNLVAGKLLVNERASGQNIMPNISSQFLCEIFEIFY